MLSFFHLIDFRQTFDSIWNEHFMLHCKSKSNVINSLAFEWDEICVFQVSCDKRKGGKEREQKTNRYVGQNDGKMVTETHRVSVHTTHKPESTTDEMRREIIKKIRYCSIARSERRPKWNRGKKLNQFNLVVAFSIVVNLFTIKWNFSIRSPYLSIFASKTIQNPTFTYIFCNFNNFENVIFRFPNCFFLLLLLLPLLGRWLNTQFRMDCKWHGDRGWRRRMVNQSCNKMQN